MDYLSTGRRYDQIAHEQQRVRFRAQSRLSTLHSDKQHYSEGIREMAFFSRIQFLSVALFAVTAGAANSWSVAQEQPAKKVADSEAKKPANLPSGINDSFLDPDMNVEEFISRFEIESREVFACREQILKSIQLEPKMSVADIGSGTGLYLKALSKSVGEEGRVFAVDISPNFIKHLRTRVKDEELGNVEVVLCSDRDVNLKPNSVDRVFICDVYHHFEYPESSLKSIRRALRDGGKLVLVDFDRIEGESREWLMGHIRAPKSVFKQEIIDAGFKFEGEIEVDGFKENYLLRFTK